MSGKPMVAFACLGGCGGCDESLLDLHETLLELAERVDIAYWNIPLDFKRTALESLPAASLALSLVNGNVRNSEQRELALLLRQKSRLVLACGACACFGGTPALANLVDREEILSWIYREAPTVTNPAGLFPTEALAMAEGEALELPAFYGHVYALHQVIPVDYFLPGCPPPADLVGKALNAFLANTLPPRGATLAPQRAVCDQCPHNRSKPSRLEIRQLRRVHQLAAHSEGCFLARGALCLGPATRGGCGEVCLRTGTPCRGCFGPLAGVGDGGARFIAALAALLKADTEEELQELLGSLHDLTGYCYRFTGAVSTLERRSLKETN
jgi:F420-non-reducing hydrogenase small subunit